MQNHSAQIFKLILHPRYDCVVPSWNEIQSTLIEIGFLGKPYGLELDKRFFVGDRFLQLITFMGCSPHLKLEPEAENDDDFCHIRLSSIFSTIQFRSKDSNVFARCPECGRRIAEWQQLINAWQNDPSDAQFQCSACNAAGSPLQLSWRYSAGFSRLFIDVYSIYPQEGIPTEQLLSALEKASSCEWSYFYTNV